MKARVIVFALTTVAAAVPEARASEQGSVVRVISDGAEVRTGPSFTYRTVYMAERGEVLPVAGRATHDYWFRVNLPDGTWGWILGDQVLPLEVDPVAPGPPSLGAQVVDAVFSPPPLPSGNVGMSFSAGVLGGEGLILFRPMLLLAPHLGLEGFVGETVGEQADIFYYGAGTAIFLWPASPVTPFIAGGGGGALGRKKSDQFAIRTGQYATANIGGGLLFALKKRITLRFDFRDHVIFGPNYTRELREYSGGLALFF